MQRTELVIRKTILENLLGYRTQESRSVNNGKRIVRVAVCLSLYSDNSCSMPIVLVVVNCSPFQFQNCSGLNINESPNMEHKRKNYGIPKKETIMLTEGLIKDISEEEFCF